MARYIMFALFVAGFLFATASDAGAAMVTWKYNNTRCKVGTTYPLPGKKDACGRQAIFFCFPKGSPLPPPTPCNAAPATAAAQPKKLIPVDPDNRFGNAPIHRKLQVVTHGSPHFDPGALSIDKKRKIKRGLKPIDMNERIP